MSATADWVRLNCKFAAPAPVPDPTQAPAIAPSLTTEGPPKAPLSETVLLKRKRIEDMEQEMDQRIERWKPPMTPVSDEGQLASDISDMRVPPREVFDRMAGDVRTMQEALTFVDNPSFPAFTEAYRKAFGDKPASDTARLLRQIESFLTHVSQDPKFAEILTKVRKRG